MSYKCCLAIDLDNTIIAYDQLFARAALERQLITQGFTGKKKAVRDVVRQGPGGELAWQALQADVYGELINCAPPFPGVHAFIARARELDAQVTIVSHKTAFAAARPNGIHLVEAAKKWLYANDFIDGNLIAENDVYFETSREGKIERIRALGAHIVIDDLAEVLTDPGFPSSARRWLFAPERPSSRLGEIECFGSWREMREALDE